MRVELLHGECLDEMRFWLPDNSVDAIVTDPPYGLKFMGKRWDYDVPSVAVWAECLRVLKPGGHLLSFAGTRTQHRMAARIEDAGFEIRDLIMWVYGSGFPKSMDVQKAIDKAQGVEGTFGGPKSAAHAGWIDRGRMRGDEGHDGYQRPWMGDPDAVDRNARVYVGGSEDSRRWAGWGTALKPALEPITVARKPMIGTVAENVLMHGCGGLNIDECRIDGVKGVPASPRRAMQGSAYGDLSNDPGTVSGWDANVGRWPANLIHDGSDEVLTAFSDALGQLGPVSASAPSSRSKNVYGAMTRSGEPSADSSNNGAVGFKMKPGGRRFDEGSAARFFYCAKASKTDRGAGNDHPTVKPIDLMRYLIRLVTPPGGLVLDPYMGSGSTGRAAVLEGFRFIGIEREAEYVRLAQARIDDAVSIRARS